MHTQGLPGSLFASGSWPSMLALMVCMVHVTGPSPAKLSYKQVQLDHHQDGLLALAWSINYSTSCRQDLLQCQIAQRKARQNKLQGELHQMADAMAATQEQIDSEKAQVSASIQQKKNELEAGKVSKIHSLHYFLLVVLQVRIITILMVCRRQWTTKDRHWPVQMSSARLRLQGEDIFPVANLVKIFVYAWTDPRSGHQNLVQRVQAKTFWHVGQHNFIA